MIAILLVLTGIAVAEPVRKPSAPVQLSIESQPTRGGYIVTLIAVPRRAVPSLELSIAGKQVGFGVTAQGERRELSAFVAVPFGAGVDVFGGARLAGRHKAAYTRLGTVKVQAARRTTTRKLLDGREVEEVR